MTFLRIVIPLYVFCLSMISGQTLRVCPEGKPVPTLPDHALARTGVHEVDSLSACNFSKNQGAKHRNRIRRGSVKMPGDLSRGVEARHRPTLAQDFRFLIGGETAKCVGDGADQGYARYGGFVMARAQFDFGGSNVSAAANPSQRAASNRATLPLAAALNVSTVSLRWRAGIPICAASPSRVSA